MLVTKKKRLAFRVMMVVLVLGVSAASAQQKDPRLNPPLAPLPPLSPGESSSKLQNTESAVPAQAAGSLDQPSLSSSRLKSLGSGVGQRNLLLPSFSFYQGADTNPRGLGGNADLNAVTTVDVRLALQHVWDRYMFQADYSGGGSFYSSVSGLNRSHQDLGLLQTVRGGRWSMSWSDVISYSPEGNTGLGAGLPSQLPSPVSAGPFGGSLGNLNPFLVPNQSILSINSPRISNTVLTEAQFAPDRHSTVTFSGSYSILRFLDSGFLDGSSASFRTGYDHALTARDTLGISYGASLFRYDNIDLATDSHVVFLSYGRQITGRLALQISAGPQITQVNNPSAGSGTTRFTSWSGQAFLRYRLAKSDLSVVFLRGVTGGAGLLPGAETDDVSMSVGRQLSRVWRGAWTVAYAHNGALRGTGAGVNPATYNRWRAGFQLSRPAGRHTRLYFDYSFERQTSGIPGCTGPGCAFFGTRHIFGIGFNFQPRPIALE